MTVYVEKYLFVVPNLYGFINIKNMSGYFLLTMLNWSDLAIWVKIQYQIFRNQSI